MQEIFTATTVEEAVQLGLNTWHVNESQVKIEVEDQGKKGLFGLGKKNAIISLTLIDPELKKYTLEELKERHTENKADKDVEVMETIDVVEKEPAYAIEDEGTEHAEIESSAKRVLTDSADTTLHYLINILKEMNIEATGEVSTRSNEVRINLASDDAARIIGKRGHTLNALQTIAQTHIQQTHKGYITVMLDIEDYRAKRKEILENLAVNMAQKALNSHEPVKFEPMPNYERKIIHQVLTRMAHIETYSEGREPHRYLVIKAK